MSGHDASYHARDMPHIVQIIMATFSTCYNVVLYAIYNPGFRSGYSQLICCRPVSVISILARPKFFYFQFSFDQ